MFALKTNFYVFICISYNSSFPSSFCMNYLWTLPLLHNGEKQLGRMLDKEQKSFPSMYIERCEEAFSKSSPYEKFKM